MKARVALLASIFSLGLVAVVAAQVSTTTGTVVSNSGGVLVVDTDSGQRTFMVDAQSSVPASLAAGTRVTVEYHTLANDKFHAFKVTPSAGTAPTTTSNTDMTGTSTTGSTPATPAPSMQEQPTTTTGTTTGSTSMRDTTATTGTTTGTTAGTMQDRPVTTPTDTATRTDTTDSTDTTTPTTTDDTTTRTLPATASPLPLLALAGSLALAGGALLRRRRA
jgi:hypothetical protein